MSQTNETADGACVLKLAPILDITAAPDLKRDLLAHLGREHGVRIDAGEVQRAGALCLQVLASAARSFAGAGGPLRFIAASRGFRDAAEALALTSVLGLGDIADA